MTVSSIVEKIKTNLNESGLTYFSQEDILEIIQDGYDEIVTLSGCIEKYTTYPKINDLIYYQFGDGIADLYSIMGIWNSTTGRWLNPCTRKEAISQRYDWELMDGEPDNFIIIDYKHTAVFPTQSIVTGAFLIFYNATADALGMSSVPRLPAKHFDVLENYAMAALLEQGQEFKKASEYLKEYLGGIPKLKHAAKAAASIDRLMVIGDSMPRFAESQLEEGMWIDFETPTVINPTTLTIVSTPTPTSAFYLYRDGILLYAGIGYTRTGTTITLSPGYEDISGTTVWRASYRV